MTFQESSTLIAPLPRNHFIFADIFPAEVVEAMKKDLEELVGKRVRIQVSEPIEFFGPWGWGDLFGRVVSQYVDYEGGNVLEIEFDFEVDWEMEWAKRIVVASRFTDERFPGGYYPSWEGSNLLSLLEGKEVTINVYRTKYRLTTQPPEKPDLVAIGIIRLIEKESWMKTEEEKRTEESEERDERKKRKPEKKTGWRIPKTRDVVIRIRGDFNNLIAKDIILLDTAWSLEDLKRLGRRIRPGRRVVINDDSFEAEGVLELKGKYWRARILWDTGRWLRPATE